MKSGLIAAIVALGGLAALAQPAAACPAGYEAVWIDGNKVCKFKTPKLPLKVLHELGSNRHVHPLDPPG
jgi:hypothetical protein